MRDFINWNILHRVEKSSKEYIVQRKVSLLNAFLFGYEILLQLVNEEKLKEKYENILSIEEYARKKYNANNIGTRNFSSIISFISEGEQDFFYKYFDFLKEYEKTYPIQESTSYMVKESVMELSLEQTETNPYRLKELLKGMRQRYPMYFGNYDISCFRAFLDGYFLCKKEYNIPFTTFDKKVKKFTESIICETLKLTSDFITWDRQYRYDRDWNSWGDISETTAKKILESFWIDLEIFTNENIE